MAVSPDILDQLEAGAHLSSGPNETIMRDAAREIIRLRGSLSEALTAANDLQLRVANLREGVKHIQSAPPHARTLNLQRRAGSVLAADKMMET